MDENKMEKRRMANGGNQKRFTESDTEFNKALTNLKFQKLITSRTNCQKIAGLTCTRKGHNLIRI